MQVLVLNYTAICGVPGLPWTASCNAVRPFRPRALRQRVVPGSVLGSAPCSLGAHEFVEGPRTKCASQRRSEAKVAACERSPRADSQSEFLGLAQESNFEHYDAWDIPSGVCLRCRKWSRVWSPTQLTPARSFIDSEARPPDVPLHRLHRGSKCQANIHAQLASRLNVGAKARPWDLGCRRKRYVTGGSSPRDLAQPHLSARDRVGTGTCHESLCGS